MNEYAWARALHVVAVVAWIGGVAFVTTVLLPSIRKTFPPEKQYGVFEAVEHRFGWQARGWVLLALASAAWMLHLTGGWARVWSTPWLGLMLAAWVPFFLMLFVLEPFVVHRWLHRRAQVDPVGTMRLMQALHVVLLALSGAAVLFGVAGAHGGL
jgi:uncharacterized membrane protein